MKQDGSNRRVQIVYKGAGNTVSFLLGITIKSTVLPIPLCTICTRLAWLSCTFLIFLHYTFSGSLKPKISVIILPILILFRTHANGNASFHKNARLR